MWYRRKIMSPIKNWAGCALALAVWAGLAMPAMAVSVRIASFNVYYGIDTGADRTDGLAGDDYAATLATFQRVQPDIVCFQELETGDKQAWVEAAATLGYSYYAFASTTGGTFAGTARLGIWSKYPILSTDEVKETDVDPTAKEMTRWPLHAVIQVPGALNPFHVFSVHNKSTTVSKPDRLRRAFEIRRTVNYLTNLVAQYPLDVLLGGVIIGNAQFPVRVALCQHRVKTGAQIDFSRVVDGHDHRDQWRCDHAG